MSYREWGGREWGVSQTQQKQCGAHLSGFCSTVGILRLCTAQAGRVHLNRNLMNCNEQYFFFFFRVCLWQWSSFSSCPSRTWNISRKTTPQQSQMLTDMQHLHLIPCYLLFERAERCSFPQMTMSRLKDSVELCSTKWYSPILTPMVMWEIYLFTQQER